LAEVDQETQHLRVYLGMGLPQVLQGLSHEKVCGMMVGMLIFGRGGGDQVWLKTGDHSFELSDQILTGVVCLGNEAF
jgi:hypothetical protein